MNVSNLVAAFCVHIPTMWEQWVELNFPCPSLTSYGSRCSPSLHNTEISFLVPYLCAEVCGAMQLFSKVSNTLERRGTGTGARDMMSSSLHATSSPMDGQTLWCCWSDLILWLSLAVFREPAAFVHSPARTVICRPVTLDTQVWSRNSPSKIYNESSGTEYFSFPLSLSFD